MTELFADERLQFFLRNREDIKTWAAIESDVIAATRELLARAQVDVEERLLSLDGRAVVGRHDSGQWERILIRHDSWPATVGVAMEWHRLVDPAGSTRPKLGVFWWADPSSLIEPRKRMVTAVDRTPLLALGYKVPFDGVWPVGRLAASTTDWWHEPEVWIANLVELLASTWPVVAPVMDQLLASEPPVIDA